MANKHAQEIGRKLKSFRQEKNMTQGKVAVLLGISVPAYSKIETGITDVNLSRLFQFCEVFKIHIADLIVDRRINLDVEAYEDLKTLVAEQQTIIIELQQELIQRLK